MDYTRQRDWFDPDKTDASVTIVGCGGIGSFAAFALAKLGVQRITLVDYDMVDEHNVPNQLFGWRQVNQSKVSALARTLGAYSGDFAPTYPRLYEQPLQEGVPLSDVVVSALDSMSARADLWQQVKYKVRCKLFLDARLGGEHVILYAVNPCRPDDAAGYERTLYSDDEASELPCTARSIIDVGFAVGSLITRAVRRHYAREALEPTVYLNQQTLDIFKGGWDR
jgi:ThiF family